MHCESVEQARTLKLAEFEAKAEECLWDLYQHKLKTDARDDFRSRIRPNQMFDKPGVAGVS